MEPIKKSLAEKFLLLVDDDVNTVNLLEEILTSLSPTVRCACASSGQEALQVVGKQMPDIIVLDIMMPDMDGIEFLEKFRKLPKAGEVPVLIVTAYPEPAERIKSKGPFVICPKPFDVDTLLDQIHNLLSKEK